MDVNFELTGFCRRCWLGVVLSGLCGGCQGDKGASPQGQYPLAAGSDESPASGTSTAVSPGLTYQCFGQDWQANNPRRMILNLCDFDCCALVDSEMRPTGAGTVLSLALESTDPNDNGSSQLLTPSTYRIFVAIDTMPEGQFAIGYYGTAADWSRLSDAPPSMKPVIEGTVTIDRLVFSQSTDVSRSSGDSGSLGGNCQINAPEHPKVHGTHPLNPKFVGSTAWMTP